MDIKDLPSPLRLDLACGQNKKEGFYGIDIVDIPGVDMVLNLEKYPWPFKDNSVDEVFVSHFVEHVKDIIPFMDELYRVLKTGSKATIVAPYYNNVRCWMDPTHVRAISESSFLYYSKKWRTSEKLTHYPIKANFELSWTYVLDGGWHSIWPYMDENSRSYAVKSYTNVVDDIIAFLVKI